MKKKNKPLTAMIKDVNNNANKDKKVYVNKEGTNGLYQIWSTEKKLIRAQQIIKRYIKRKWKMNKANKKSMGKRTRWLRLNKASRPHQRTK